jgi:hypothetical protein
MNTRKALLLSGIGLFSLTIVLSPMTIKGPGVSKGPGAGIDTMNAAAMDAGGGGEGGGSGGASGGGGEGGGGGDPSGGDRGPGGGQTGGGQSDAGDSAEGGTDGGQGGGQGGAGERSGGKGDGGKGDGGKGEGGENAGGEGGEVGGNAAGEASVDLPAADDGEMSARLGAAKSQAHPAIGTMPPNLPAGETESQSRLAPPAARVEEAKLESPPAAIVSLQEAAERGDAEAQFELAVAYEKGLLVNQDTAWAARWYGRAAFRGHSEAQYKYASLKLTGARQDLSGAYRWLTIAALQGHGRADEARAKLELRLSIDQLYREQAWTAAFEPATTVSPWDPPTVEFLQNKLAELGYDPGPADGFMGPRTTAALENYKKSRGWTATNHLSEDLLQIIRKEDR